MTPGVLFDLDGTLVDHRAAADAAVAEWVARYGGRRDAADDAVAEWGRLEGLHFAAYLRGEATFQEQRRGRIAEFLAFLGRPVPDADAMDRLFQSYLDLYEAAWVAYDDVVPALDLLAASGVALGVLTNGDEAQQRAKLRAVGLLDRFDCVVASSSLPAAKPDATAFVAACERLGRPPGSVSYVGDNLHTDALAAAQAGLRGVWLNRLSEDPHVQPEATIRSLLEIEALLG
ncbi:HAD-IA family hydrolase [Nocardioides sp. dk4132]|uniref:HAD family hydrolase n=1 Tax=unclassified Nocardioides TaxID=2615069 RepID=UPI00129811F4|nr:MULTISPECIES: HAD family hydrolase [unclassified Nocardioides]MQW74870.1 HAD-IA family hydrolase [Nocardioides sp. dk4132]QGA06757.1 HAD-IA family hydrolase [Nocardioides sp. dk884]